MRPDRLFARLFAALFIAFVPLQTLHAGEEPPPVAVRIVTFNVKEGVGNPGSSTFLAIGAFLTTNDVDGPGPNSGLNPDIVCLQECRSNTNLLAFRDQFLPGYQFVRVLFVDAGGNFNACFVRPDWPIVDDDALGTAGPRRALRITVSIPGALKPLTLINCHFKAFGDSASQATRTQEANTIGMIAYDDINLGVDVNDDGIRETDSYVIVLGDFNSNNNNDGTITGMFTHATLGVPTGVLNLPVESLAGQNQPGLSIATFPSSGSRLDYICLQDELALFFDADMSGTFNQDEINSMGFVYYSGDDNGMRSNGNASATSFASDHRPVVFSIWLPGDPNAGFDPKDINFDGFVNVEDLHIWEELFFSGGSAPDVNQDFVTNIDDRDAIRNCARMDELTDVMQ